MMALDRNTGEREWVSRPIDTQKGSESYSSPVTVGGVVIVGVSGGIAELTGDESVRYEFQGSLVMLDADSGRILEKTWTIHAPTRTEDDFAGAGIWGTPAVDRRAKVAYVGTANPYVPSAAHPHAGAILKFDVDRSSRNFGEIVGFGEGTPEEYLDAFTDLPCIDFPGNVPPYPTGLGSCFDLDLDFGASPNLYRDPSGRLLVGAGQKSGIYHTFDAKTMEPVWSSVVGPPGYFGGIVGSTAYDGEAFYGPITIPGYVWSIKAGDGTLRWIGPVLDALHWGPPVSVANGVAYTVDFLGFLDAFDAETGAVLLKTPLSLDGSAAAAHPPGVASRSRATPFTRQSAPEAAGPAPSSPIACNDWDRNGGRSDECRATRQTGQARRRGHNGRGGADHGDRRFQRLGGDDRRGATGCGPQLPDGQRDHLPWRIGFTFQPRPDQPRRDLRGDLPAAKEAWPEAPT